MVRGVRLERVALLRHDVHGGQSLGPLQQRLVEAREDVALQLEEGGGRTDTTVSRAHFSFHREKFQQKMEKSFPRINPMVVLLRHFVQFMKNKNKNKNNHLLFNFFFFFLTPVRYSTTTPRQN